MNAFIQGATSLNKPELDLLGDVDNKSIMHLQCHFGQDSLSLSRMGAKVTGLDFSPKAINYAIELNRKLQLDAHFIESNVLDLKHKVEKKYDLVYTSYGTIGWLEDLELWADSVLHCLAPGGTFIIVDFHPAMWMLDDDMKELFYSYFKGEPIIEESGSYTENTTKIKSKCVSWNHSFEELFSPLLSRGLKLQEFKEFNSSPYNCLPNMIKVEDGYQLKKYPGIVPMIYGIKMKL